MLEELILDCSKMEWMKRNTMIYVVGIISEETARRYYKMKEILD